MRNLLMENNVNRFYEMFKLSISGSVVFERSSNSVEEEKISRKKRRDASIYEKIVSDRSVEGRSQSLAKKLIKDEKTMPERKSRHRTRQCCGSLV